MGKIEKNFMWLTAANLVGGLFTATLFIYLARTLRAQVFGYISYASTFVLYLFNFVDLGLSTYGIREVAKDRPRASEYLSNIASFKFIVATLLFLVFCLITFLSHNSLTLKILMAETALMLFATALATEWAFQGMEQMHMVFISLATTSFLQLSLNFLFVKEPGDILKVPIINFISSIPIITIFLKRLKFRMNIVNIDFKRIRYYLSSSLVIWAISVCTQAYNGLDIVIMGFFRAPQEVGYFTVARRIAGGATLLMILLANAVLPRLSCTFNNDIGEFNIATRKFLKLSVFIIVLVLLPVMVFSSQLISLTVGAEYIPASLPLKIMIVALILVLFNMPYSTGLIAACFEKEVLKQAVSAAALNITLNFVLIPKYGMIGASISFLTAEMLALTWILWVYNKKIGFTAKSR